MFSSQRLPRPRTWRFLPSERPTEAYSGPEVGLEEVGSQNARRRSDSARSSWTVAPKFEYRQIGATRLANLSRAKSSHTA